MSSIVPFEKCVARPGSLLKDHLTNVRFSMETFFYEYDDKLIKLIGLSGLCHDIGKSNAEWQQYINNDKANKGPTHSACGAFFFSYLGYHILWNMGAWEKYCIYWLWLSRDIADHHGKLGQLSDDSWLKRYPWNMFDLNGIQDFIHDQYDELRDVFIDEEMLESWIDDGQDIIEDVLDLLDLGYELWDPLVLMNKIQRWRMLTTSLIAGDRFDVKAVETSWIDKDEAVQYSENIDLFCMKNQQHPLSKTRMDAQKSILCQLKNQPNSTFYKLDMPTGYGKTITALKIATWFGEKQGYKKIIYVAPYLSILEQTSRVIENAMQESSLEHHSLAILDREDDKRIGQGQLWVESWAHSIVCTSFHQFTKAIFPKRAQEVLRRRFLEDCVIIIDEPQIFDPDVWNLFLCGLESLARSLNFKVLFLSATMPPFKYGLKQVPMELKVEAKLDQDRYNLYMKDKKDERSLADFLRKNERRSQAAILNTIEDAYCVYKNLDANHLYLLHGLMIPLHKNIIIKKIGAELENNTEPLYVISTQVIEAGVDLSFQHVARALPIMPSIVQAAGRVNRHGESKDKGIISVFPFYRSGEKDTRTYIYPKVLQKITDQLLSAKEIWTEVELTLLVKDYYEKMFRQNTYETAMTYIKDAYQGNWERLSSFTPFKEDYLRLPIFIPWDPSEEEEKYLSDKFTFLQKKFCAPDADRVYELYSDQRYMSSLSFDDRKEFMILFHHYVLNVPVKKALEIASKDDFLKRRIIKLFDTHAYDHNIGLVTPFEEYDNFI